MYKKWEYCFLFRILPLRFSLFHSSNGNSSVCIRIVFSKFKFVKSEWIRDRNVFFDLWTGTFSDNLHKFGTYLVFFNCIGALNLSSLNWLWYSTGEWLYDTLIYVSTNRIQRYWRLLNLRTPSTCQLLRGVLSVLTSFASVATRGAVVTGPA
jgi:hypothetical protein